MIGMVLAAGAGRRLRPYTDTLPKALVPVDGETTILDIALRNLAAVGLTEVVVVVGYAAEAVRARQAELEQRHGVTLTLVFNDKAEEWNNAYSLWLAREYFDRGVLLLNGDTVHPVDVERILLAEQGPGVLLAVDTVKKLAEEEMKTVFDDAGRLTRITKLMDPAQAYGEYIGATLIAPHVAADLAGQLPVGEGTDVAHHVADAAPVVPVRSALHEVQVDDDRDRDVHAVRALDAAGDEAGDRGGDAVVGEAGCHRHHRQAAPGRGVLGHVDGFAAADADHRVVRAGPQLAPQVVGGLEGAAGDGEDVGRAQRRPDQLDDLLGLPRADHHRHITAGGDPSVGEDGGQVGHRAPPHVDGERGHDGAG